MPISVTEVIAALGRVAPLSKAGGWDPVGLQLGDPSKPVGSAAVVHEVTEAVVGRLLADPVDLVIAYHPLLFRPTTRMVAGRTPTGRAFRLVETGVALGVVHTAYDVAPGGAADALAEDLGLVDAVGFGPSWGPDAAKIVTFVPRERVEEVGAAMTQAGAGVIGNYTGCSYRTDGIGTFFAGEGTTPTVGAAHTLNAEPETRIEMISDRSAVDRVVAALVASHPYEEPAYDVYEVRSNAGFIGRQGRLDQPAALDDFARQVGNTLGGAVRMAGDPEGMVQEVAVVPGSGSSFLAAISADVVVTGDVGHHHAREALDRGMAVVDPGHASTERPGISRLYAAVAQIVDDPVDLTDLAADPWEPVWKS